MSDSKPPQAAVAEPRSSSFFVGEWLAEPQWNRLRRNSETVKLEPRVMRLLAALAATPNQPVQRQELLDTIWSGTFVNEEALSRAVSQLRRALGDDTKAPRYLQTVHKTGYCLIAPVADAADEAIHPAPSPQPFARPSRRQFLAGAVLLLLLGAFAGSLLYRDTAPAPLLITPRPLVPLTSDPGREIDPAVSPDGSRVAYLASTETGYDVFVRGIGDGAPARLTRDSLAKGHLVWSPSGDRLAFVASQGEAAAILVIAETGGEARKLVDLSSWSFGLDWSPDGRTLAYVDAARGEKPGIVLLDIETKAARPISGSTELGGGTKPAFSPDGTRLAFLRNDPFERQQVAVVDLRRDEGGVSLLAPPQQLRGFDWAPDGASVIVSARSGRKFKLWRLATDGNASPEPFPTEGGELFNPSISRNGRVVAEEVEQDRDIWAVGWDGSDPAPLVRSTTDDFEPAYGPVGAGLAFVSERSGSAEIWLQSPTGDARRLTSLSGSEPRQLAWSPDGARLAFVTEAKGVGTIYAVPAKGGEAVRLPGIGASAVPLGWAADGHVLFLLAPAAGGWHLREYSISGRQTRSLGAPLVSLAVVAPDGKSLFAVPAGENKLLQIVSGRGTVHQLRLPPSSALTALLAARDAIYLVEEARGAATVRRLDLATGATSAARRIEAFGGGTLSVAPDGRSLAFTRSRETANDLVWIRL